MDNQKSSDAEIRTLLLSAARELMAQDANFSVKALLTRAKITRAQFRRHFTGKAELLSALAGQDVQELTDILVGVQPVRQSLLRKAVGSDAAPAPAPAPSPSGGDQWLERRLRVFERALAALEKRQEQSEQNLIQALARLNEKLDMPAAVPVAPVEEPVVQAEPVVLPEEKVDAPEEQTGALGPAILEHVEHIADGAIEDEPEIRVVSEKEIQAFIAHAREAANNAAALAEAAPPQARKTPWLAWGGAAAVLLLLLAIGLFLTGGAFGHGRALAGSGVTHRQVAQSGVARMLALADNGDAAAQAKLALAYLRGDNGMAGSDAAAMRWSKAAAAQGHPVAQYLLGTLTLETDQAEAARWFQRAAEQGNIKAMHNLAIAYAQGLGVTADPAQAVIWFVRAASHGYRDSQFDLAVLYERGDGVAQDPVAALKWYRIAAAQGDEASMVRAQFLMTQLKAAEVNAAMDEAAAFAPKPGVAGANEAARL